MIAQFRVDGIPKAQGRPKAFMRGKHAGVYDPKTANDWKRLVLNAGREHRPATPIEGPLVLSIDFFFPRPKSLCRKKDPEGPVWHESKPDRDNCEKAILDALKQDGWFRDDSQVCSGTVRKLYHEKGGRPGCVILITEASQLVLDNDWDHFQHLQAYKDLTSPRPSTEPSQHATSG